MGKQTCSRAESGTRIQVATVSYCMVGRCKSTTSNTCPECCHICIQTLSQSSTERGFHTTSSAYVPNNITYHSHTYDDSPSTKSSIPHETGALIVVHPYTHPFSRMFNLGSHNESVPDNVYMQQCVWYTHTLYLPAHGYRVYHGYPRPYRDCYAISVTPQ